ncbi:hypothetical protein PV394_08150 [Streptomyces sp. NE06-03E]|uniref:ABC transporter ATP-binding protein n=1 Tax=Streptomyces silvae TaxID=2803812 RepID=A0ABU7ZXR7_9ACTN|nr:MULTISPECIES: hypothetical protein [unclassified Streptomyces]WSS68013.1 hypothetical protein OG491_06770 [Streptomyces sp. NBC_01175]WSS75009.1 hypothetical protein OG414_07055 [Streptomyces sp. NBC_01174]MDX3055106.1 hypothetical protein [Streptomyces sp. NE06-03E]MDX3326375.1 hypothetical protein [Streptomyces sp. ME02-6979-3A]MDX3429702.1 hypothetical protein [Streptomyces sp. ME01-18a]
MSSVLPSAVRPAAEETESVRMLTKGFAVVRGARRAVRGFADP